MISFVQLEDDVQFVHWSKSTGNNQGGGNGRFLLPAFASNPPATHTFWIMSHNPVDETGGEIILQHVSGGQDFHNASDDQQDLQFSGNHCTLKKPGRNTYSCTYYHATEKWHIRRVSSNITGAQITQIAEESHFTNHFANDEASYPQGTPYQCPSDRMRIDLIYGDGSDFSSTSVGVHFYLPISPKDGCLVVAENTMNKNTSTASNTLSLRWKLLSGMPATRKLNYILGSTFTSIVPPTSTYGTAWAVQAYGTKTLRDFWRFKATGDFWVHSRDSN